VRAQHSPFDNAGARAQARDEDATSVIITGVPSAGRDDGYVLPSADTSMAPAMTARHADYTEARDRAAALAYKPPPLPRPSTKPVVERQYVRASVAPRTDSDPGRVIEGAFTAVDGVVRVYDAAGRLLATEPFKPGDNVEVIARRLLRAKQDTGFYGPLPYRAH
jgi:hypothetical protein